MAVRVSVVLALAVVTGACAGTAADVASSGLPAATVVAPQPTERAAPVGPVLADHEAAVAETLDAVAVAFQAGDAAALRPWLADPDSDFGQRWLARARNMADVPFSSYGLALDESAADLTTAAVPDGDGLLVNVVEAHGLQGFEELGELRSRLLLTLRPGAGERWLVAGDTDAERLGLPSADHLWDHGPVVATRRGPVLVLHHPGQASVGTILSEAQRALTRTEERWPLPWPGMVPLLVPADAAELAALLHVTFDLDDFVAFATATPVVERGAEQLAGSRVLLNTESFLSRSTASREDILLHEFVHAASRPSSSRAVPSWLEEGVAQALGQQSSSTGTSLLAALTATDWDGALPLDAEFSTGGRDGIFLSYQRAWSFVDWLAEQHGTAAVGDFYRRAGQGSVGDPGTSGAMVDEAAVATFGSPLADLVVAWRASLSP